MTSAEIEEFKTIEFENIIFNKKITPEQKKNISEWDGLKIKV